MKRLFFAVLLAILAGFAATARAQTESVVRQWERVDSFGGTPGAIAVDTNGNVFVAGGASTSTDGLVVGYSGSGTALWTNRYNGPANSTDSLLSVIVDGAGNVIVTGSSESGAAFGTEDYLTIKYSVTGVPLWTNRYNGP